MASHGDVRAISLCEGLGAVSPSLYYDCYFGTNVPELISGFFDKLSSHTIPMCDNGDHQFIFVLLNAEKITMSQRSLKDF